MKHSKSMIDDPKRRQLLIGLGSVLGAATADQLLDGNAFSIAMAYAESSKPPTPKIFSPEQLSTLKHVCQTVIPATQTLGAGDIDTQNFIDNQLHHCFDKNAQALVLRLIELLDTSSQKRSGDVFAELKVGEAHALLSDLDLAQNEFSAEQSEGFKFLKSLIVFGYYTSEVGASQELKHERIPGGFNGSVPLANIGAAWGSLDFF